MYTILVTNENEMVVTVKERIIQRSKMVDKLHFLVEPLYKGIDMTPFTVTLEYVLPISKKYCSEVLVKAEELYKEHLEYLLPFDTQLTQEQGEIELQLTFTNVEMDAEGKVTQYVRKISPPVKVTIIPISNWSDLIPDSALNVVDQKMLELDSKMKALEEMSGLVATSKADNIVLDTETHELYLVSNGVPIGNKITTDDLGDSIVESTSDEGLVTVIL